MLLVDLYKVKSVKDLIFHKDLYSILLDKNKKNLPNLLIHGLPGSGKNTLIQILLESIYGKEYIRVSKQVYSICGYGNTNVDVEIKQSNYHIIIEPNNSGFDKYLIQEIVNEYAKRKLINVINNINYKIVFINNIDNLSFYAQTSLRCTMEKYHDTCKFILCGNQVSKIIDPLKSRCLDIRVPCPTDLEMLKLLLKMCYYEKIDPSIYKLRNIIKIANGNTKIAIWLLEYYKCKIDIDIMSWKQYLAPLLDIIYNISIKKTKLNLTNVASIRNILNTILITNITGSEIMIEMINKIVNYDPPYPDYLIHKIINIFAEYESRLSKGKRSIMHLEGLIINIIYILTTENKIII